MAQLGTNPTGATPDSPPIQDRRAIARQKVHSPAYVTLDSSSPGMVLDLSEVLDIHEQGVCIQSSAPLKVGSTLPLGLDLSETRTFINTTGEVMWSAVGGRTGLRFPGMPAPSRRQLQEWLRLNALAASAEQVAQSAQMQGPSDAGPAGPTLAARLQEDAFATTPDYTTVLTALAAVRREVEMLGSNLARALQLIAERARSFTGATGAAIALSDGENKDEMMCRAASGPDAPPVGAKLQVGSGFSGECVRLGRLLRCDDTETDPRVDSETCRQLGIRSMIAVPIRIGDSAIGLLEVFSPNANAFGPNDNTILQRLADTALAAVNRAARARQAESAATPPITQPAPDLFAVASGTAHPKGRTRLSIFVAVGVVMAVVVAWLVAPYILKKASAGSSAHVPQNVQPQQNSQPVVVAPVLANTLDELRKLAEHGDPASQFAVGIRYATGQEVGQDYEEAVRWFSRAAEQGWVPAQATLGTYYWAGRGVPKDLTRGYFWTVLAQAGGDKDSKAYVSVIASQMTHSQMVAAQQEANDWLRNHQLAGHSPTE